MTNRILAILALFFLVQISPYWYAVPDAGGYLSLARAIALDHWPTNLGRAQLYYSPGYPLLISPAFALAEPPFLLISVINCGLGVLFMAGVYVWARRNVPPAALVITALTVVNVDVLALYRRALSETAFMPLLMWTVNVLQCLAQDAIPLTPAPLPRVRGRREQASLLVLASLLMAFLAMTRPAGILVAAAFGVTMIIEAWRGTVTWRCASATTLAVALPATIVLAGLAHYDQTMAERAGTPTYLHQFRGSQTTLAGQLAEGVRLRVSEVGRLLIPGMFKVYGRNWSNPVLLVYVPLFLAILVGWWRFVRARLDLLALVFPFYLALYIIWPYDQGTRFFAPLLPLLCVCLWFFLEPLSKCRACLFLILIVAHAVCALGFWLFVDRPLAERNHERWPVITRLTEPVRRKGGALVAINTPPNMSLFIQYALDRPVHEAALDTLAKDVRWVILPAEQTPPMDFAQRDSAGAFQLLERK